MGRREIERERREEEKDKQRDRGEERERERERERGREVFVCAHLCVWVTLSAWRRKRYSLPQQHGGGEQC